MGSDRDFVGICWFGTQSKSSYQFGHLFKVFEVNHFDRRMHVTVGDADQCAWNAPSRPENNIRVGSAGGGDGLMLDGAFDSLGDFLPFWESSETPIHNFNGAASLYRGNLHGNSIGGSRGHSNMSGKVRIEHMGNASTTI